MTTADELFGRLLAILDEDDGQTGTNLALHEMLVLVCAQGLKGSRHGFGNLASQVESLCRLLNMGRRETNGVQKLRRDSNSSAPIAREDLLFDCRSLALLIAKVFDVAVTHALNVRLPHHPQEPTTAQSAGIDYRYIRCVVREWDEKTIRVAVLNQQTAGDEVTVDYANTPDYIDFSYLSGILREGMQLNLLDCRVANGVVLPTIIVVEPDYLLDISAIANCFEDFGHHPLLYTVNRMKPRPNTRFTLIGNFAGSALDDIINNKDYQLADTLRSNFREKALEYSTCADLNTAEFKQEAVRQVHNLQQIVGELFRTADRSKAILEPSFVCERLGIQGRVDLMTTDLRLLVEQKSGKNMFIERKSSNKHGSLHVEKHYVQVLLYYGVLAYNFNLSPQKANIRLLYSKYPLPWGLLEVQPLQKLMREAVRFRNMVVATEFEIAQNGFGSVMEMLTPETLNTEQMGGFFYENYLLPQLQKTTLPLQRLSPLEHSYFCRMMTFVIREQIVAKTGGQEGLGNSHADLWNMPLAEKKETGNIYIGLQITKKERSTDYNGFDTITLSVPEQGDGFLPNFRRGDMVYLYSYPQGEEPDVRKSILFKGALTEISTERLVVHLTDGQQNERIFNLHPLYAVEHGGSDIGGTAAIQSLHAFITAPAERKALLLGQRTPEQDKGKVLSRNYHPDYDELLLKAKQARDYFLLVGPPGTGKTSMALRFLVEEELAEQPADATSPPTELLLLSYTNRAVDEICGMLCDAGIDFIRIGNEYSCDPRFTKYLIGNAVEENPRLDTLRLKLKRARVIVSTTSSLMARPFIFSLKCFSLIIVDEASQILEPNLVGLLAASSSAETAAKKAPRFILIGDHKQLPAVVQQSETESIVTDPLLNAIHLDNCRNSLFERLLRTERSNGRETFVGVLRKHGRMHPDIAEFPTQAFYTHEQLEPVPLPHQQESSLSYNKENPDETDVFLRKRRVLFFSVEETEANRQVTSDKVNLAEAQLVANLLARLYRFYGERFDAQKTVGVIVPYRNQIATIRKEIERTGISALESISIDTVERYQGSQRDVIIYSFTISHRYQLDFLTGNCFEEDGHTIDRKLNVALTRSRKQLILTGNEQVLSANPTFKSLIDFIKEKNGFVANSKELARM
ncbi:MAG: DNA2/NAM7 family helicase [Prevotella sp.]|nr:DNA2/NAM7 family helicase [Prevotella sp.]